MKITKTATKQLMKIDRRFAKKIVAALTELEETGNGDVKKLVNREGFRLRVGQYRAIYVMDGNEVKVLEVGSRGSIY